MDNAHDRFRELKNDMSQSHALGHIIFNSLRRATTPLNTDTEAKPGAINVRAEITMA
jgi:hypothetical protein